MSLDVCSGYQIVPPCQRIGKIRTRVGLFTAVERVSLDLAKLTCQILHLACGVVISFPFPCSFMQTHEAACGRTQMRAVQPWHVFALLTTTLQEHVADCAIIRSEQPSLTCSQFARALSMNVSITDMADSPFSEPLIIIGGGLVGLTLAQALNKAGILCAVYERDDAPEIEKGGGWAITVHWALQALKDCLAADVFSGLTDIQVDREQGINDTGRFLFLDLATAQPKYEIPPSKRMRVNRQLLRQLLTQDIDIRYDKRVAHLEDSPGAQQATVHFEDSTSATSKLIVACDGSNSTMRRLIFGGESAESQLNQLPVRALGVTIRLTEREVIPLRQIDPLLFQGGHPETGTFMWYSTVSTPSLNRSDATDNPFYEGQVIISWPHKSSPADDVPSGNEQRRQLMQQKAASFHDNLRTAVDRIPEGTTIKDIRLADWPTKPWPNFNGKVTLCGDAAHAMTMYRGEAFNHGVTDAANLAKLLIKVRDKELELKEAVRQYEDEVVSRTHEAVLLSRQACLDAHDLQNLSPDSPLVSKRARILTAAKDVSAEGIGHA